MCGRFAVTTPPEAMRQLFGTSNPLPTIAARYNIAPTQPVLAVRRNPESGARSLDLLQWGLIPHWAKDASGSAKLINARAEGISDKPSFRGALAKRRCLIPADAFYEWRPGSRPKQPFAIRVDGDGPFAFAGLWENWCRPDGQWLRSCTIITTEANALLAPLHHRMPVILDPADYGRWLGDAGDERAPLLALLRPFPADRMHLSAVGTAVNAIAHDGPDLLQPLPGPAFLLAEPRPSA